MTVVVAPIQHAPSLLEFLATKALKAESEARIKELEEKVAELEFRVKANEEIQSFFLQAMFVRFPELELCYKVLREQVIQ